MVAAINFPSAKTLILMLVIYDYKHVLVNIIVLRCSYAPLIELKFVFRVLDESRLKIIGSCLPKRLSYTIITITTTIIYNKSHQRNVFIRADIRINEWPAANILQIYTKERMDICMSMPGCVYVYLYRKVLKRNISCIRHIIAYFKVF